MRKLAVILALAGALAIPGAAYADAGQYTQRDGTTCQWFSMGMGMYSIDCSGFSMTRRGFISYHCDMTIMGFMRSWTCRDFNGNTWRGNS